MGLFAGKKGTSKGWIEGRENDMKRGWGWYVGRDGTEWERWWEVGWGEDELVWGRG